MKPMDSIPGVHKALLRLLYGTCIRKLYGGLFPGKDTKRGMRTLHWRPLRILYNYIVDVFIDSKTMEAYHETSSKAHNIMVIEIDSTPNYHGMESFQA
mmetsp:Transcript_40237/g.97143  ORF Transcript_40237/g.97143 Transcript_40237/m.97143 type:complete len:98 (+) Transcript_40237:324-617(+)